MGLRRLGIGIDNYNRQSESTVGKSKIDNPNLQSEWTIDNRSRQWGRKTKHKTKTRPRFEKLFFSVAVRVGVFLARSPFRCKDRAPRHRRRTLANVRRKNRTTDGRSLSSAGKKKTVGQIRMSQSGRPHDCSRRDKSPLEPPPLGASRMMTAILPRTACTKGSILSAMPEGAGGVGGGGEPRTTTHAGQMM